MIKILATIIIVLFSTGAIGEEIIIDNPDRWGIGWDRFQLWSDCQPVFFTINFEINQNSTTSLNNEDIEIAVRSRLRSARLYNDPLDPAFLSYITVYINMYVASGTDEQRAFIQMDFKKPVRDSFFENYYHKTTWSTGTSTPTNTILQSVSNMTDRFIDEYLRVNADSC